MKESQNDINYTRIAKAIDFIRAHRHDQPDLGTVAEAVNMSPYHFQLLLSAKP